MLWKFSPGNSGVLQTSLNTEQQRTVFVNKRDQIQKVWNILKKQDLNQRKLDVDAKSVDAFYLLVKEAKKEKRKKEIEKELCVEHWV